MNYMVFLILLASVVLASVVVGFVWIVLTLLSICESFQEWRTYRQIKRALRRRR
jgi:uncharacterized protein HemY